MTNHTNRQTGALPRPRYRDRRGFTLIEALTVIVIIGLMVGMAIPRSGVSTYRANSGAQVVTSALIYAQRQAISRQADTRVAFDVANNELRIHEDSTNDNIINFNERVTATALPEGLTFGRGVAPARAMGGNTVTFTRTQGLLPIVVFHRDGTANENGGVYLTTIDGLSVGRASDVRAVEVTRATGRAVWFSYATGAWKEGH